MTAAIHIITTKDEARVDTRDMAAMLTHKHQSLFELVKTYAADFEQFGKVRFQTGASPGSRTGQTVKFALLTEDQSYLLLTYTRNTAKTRELKVALVKAFRDARAASQAREQGYLPSLHQMHDVAHALAAGSPNEKFVHINLNQLVNRVAGIEAGQRRTLAAPVMASLILAQTIATKAMAGAQDHKDGFARAKAALGPLQGVLAALDGPDVAVLEGGRHG